MPRHGYPLSLSVGEVAWDVVVALVVWLSVEVERVLPRRPRPTGIQVVGVEVPVVVAVVVGVGQSVPVFCCRGGWLMAVVVGWICPFGACGGPAPRPRSCRPRRLRGGGAAQPSKRRLSFRLLACGRRGWPKYQLRW